MITGDLLALGPADLAVPTLGDTRYPSPMRTLLGARRQSVHWVDETDRVLLDDTRAMALARDVSIEELPAFEPAGPRESLYFDPSVTRAGIVTCGGLCPGLNNVVRGLVIELIDRYGVAGVIGFKDGDRGLTTAGAKEAVPLTIEAVHGIQNDGGTILGTSRGAQDPEGMLDTLLAAGISILFVVGGDGTLRGAARIAEAAHRRGVELAVVGLPKTIDNDIPFLDRSFGFETGFARAAESIRAASTEATSTPHGVGVVKLMGRHSGFIAAEGTGQDLLNTSGTDASGNAKLADIGPLPRDRIVDHFSRAGTELTLRYVDPGYAIRSVAANGYDAVYCLRLAQAAVHAAMSGRTAMVVGQWHGRFVHIPISLATGSRNQVDPDGDLWMSVLESTGQAASY